MKKLFILIFLLIVTNGYCSFLGEFEQGSDIFIWTQICNSDGSAATNPSVVWCSLFSKNDASAPTASASMVELNKSIPGLWKYEYKLVDFATGAAVARINATVTSRQPAGIHTFYVVDALHGPNVRSILTTSDNIGINWADVSNPTNATNLSGTTTNLVNTATTVTNGVTVTTNNDKTGYSIADGQFEPVLTEIEGLQQTQGTMYASLEAVSIGVTVTTNNDKTGYSLLDGQFEPVLTEIEGLQQTQGTIYASLETAMGTGFVTGTDSLEAIRNRGDVAWITAVLTAVTLGDTSDNQRVIAGAMRTVDVASIESVEGSMVDKIDDIAASVATVAAGVDINDTTANRTVIADSMRTVGLASAEAVYGSVVQKIDDGNATGQLVWASIETIRGDITINRKEIRRNR